jgi:hypothetical protein
MHRITSAALCVGVLTLASLFIATPAAADATSFSGRATGASGNVLGIPILISDTGPLPSGGGAEQASLLSENVPGILSVDVLHATTVGQGDRSRANVSVADLTLTADNHTVSASFLEAHATARCTPSGATASGGAEIADLVVDNQTVVATGVPNQTVPVGVVTVKLNEQIPDTTDTGVTVNALHVIIPGVADVVISSAHADIVCAAVLASCAGDFVTGGGWIDGPHAAKANFAVAGGIKNSAYWGHLQFIDHGDGTKIKGTGVTQYLGSTLGPNWRHIEGTAEMNGVSGYTYSADVDDESTPGAGADQFWLKVFPSGSTTAAYAAGGMLRGGNIQLHCH